MTKRKSDNTISDNIQIAKRSKHFDSSLLSEDGALKYDFMTSLQNITAAKIVTHLWMNKNIQKEISDVLHSGISAAHIRFNGKGQQSANNIIKQLSELSLPKSITKKLTDLVPLVDQSILQWIEYNDDCVFDTHRLYSQHMAADYLDNIHWTARGKIDYQQTAKNILAKKDNGLSGSDKYTLACTYCLEEEIAILAPKVINQHFIPYLNLVKIDIHPMVHFWTCHITGDYTKFYDPSYYYHHYRRGSNDTSINEHIFQLLLGFIKTWNEVPIEYMWGKLTEEERTKNITSLMRELQHQDLRYSLLSKMNYVQQREVFKDCAGLILSDMFDDWLWAKCFLPTALHVLDIISPDSCLVILEAVIKKMDHHTEEGDAYIYYQYKSMLKELWSQIPKHLKDSVFEYEKGRLFRDIITYSLSWTRDIDAIELILSDLNIQQRKDIIFADSAGIRKCTYWIESNQWDVLHLFIKHTLFCEEDIVQFKQKLIKVKGREIAEYFLEQKELDKIAYFMQWAFKSDEEINQFRQSLVYNQVCDSALKSIVINNKVDLKDLEDHFKWCASDNIEIINQFKSAIPKLYLGITLICTLIELDKYELLDQFLNWCFCNNDQQIDKFKSNMYKDDDISSFIREVPYVIAKDNSCRLLEKFVDWCFPDQGAVQEFKYWILYPQTRSCSVCVYFLSRYEFKLADEFTKWCGLTCSEEINKFKQTLIMSEDIYYIVDSYFENAQCELKLLIEWFNPTKATVKQLKQLLSESKCPDNFYKSLDAFVQNQNIVIQENATPESPIRLDSGVANISPNIEDDLILNVIGVVNTENVDI